jgi:hypothetical protein
MKVLCTALILALALLGCGERGSSNTVGHNTALHRIERGGYVIIETRPQWLRLVNADGVEQKMFWSGGQMTPHQKSEVSSKVLRARARGFEITFISSGKPDSQSPPSPKLNAQPGNGAGQGKGGVNQDRAEQGAP